MSDITNERFWLTGKPIVGDDLSARQLELLRWAAAHDAELCLADFYEWQAEHPGEVFYAD